jgi:radical SAM protein
MMDVIQEQPLTSTPLAQKSRFEERPAVVLWETTRACLLACRHCRAKAQKRALPGELTTEEGEALLKDIADFSSPRPVVVFTGGDLLMRRDIFQLIERAHELGLHTAVSPAATELLDRAAMERFAALGVHGLSLSLDGMEVTHDRIRGVAGTFRRTLSALREGLEVGLAVQVNTVVMRSTARELADVASLLLRERIPVWEVFFLVPTGRASQEEALNPYETEDVAQFLPEVTRYGIQLRVVEGPFVRRAVRERAAGMEYRGGLLYRDLVERLRQLAGEPPLAEVRMAPYGTLDGDGVVFVAYDGTVYPGGLLPLRVGNVKEQRLPEIYRGSALLRAIRARRFLGPCGSCAYRQVCGGSRARAYALTGDPLRSDPACVHAAGL